MIVKNTTIETVRKYVSVDDASMLKNQVQALNESDETNVVTVTNTGVVSSGKSSLFNVILGKTKTERFKVGAARTTEAKDVETLSGEIVLVDTPGIDVRDEDDESAFDAVCASSIIVMIHNIKMGELKKNEVDWIKRISENFSTREEIKDRFIFVNSWIDERMGENSYEETLSKTRQMVFEAVGCEVDICDVSAELYIKGSNEKGMEELSQISNINNLRELIMKKAEVFRLKYGTKALKDSICNLCEDDAQKLSDINNTKKKRRKEIKDLLKKDKKAEEREWKTRYSRFVDLKSKCNELKELIDELEEEM